MPFEIHPSPKKTKDGRNILYVRPRSSQKITMEQLDDYCAENYALRPGELTRAFRAFIQATGYYLSKGYRMETLIGSFAPKIGLKRELTNPDEVKTYDVQFEGIEYKSVKEFEKSVLFWLDGFRRANNPHVQKLMADGHDVFIVTATYYESVPEKMKDLLFKYFPFISWDHVIITSRKQMIRGDVLIDDGVHNLEGGDYAKILVTAPHNKDYDAEANGMIRVNNWDEILKAVETLDKK